MKITIVAAGRIKEAYLTAGIAEFMKRLTPFDKVTILEIGEERMPDRPSDAEKDRTLAMEGERLLRQVPEGSYLIALDVAGKQLSSEGLAAELSALALAGKSHVTFLIGGAFGLSEAVRRAARQRLSFSKMTFTHQMARLLLVEQLYRAAQINSNGNYHK